MWKTSLFTLIFLICMISTAWSEQNVQDFRLKDVKNQWQQLSSIQGEKLTVIDFWATWCSPCAKAIPKLNKLYDRYHAKGVGFIGLNIDGQKNDAKIRPFVKAYKILYPVLKDPNSQVASRLNITSIPTLLIINSENEIVYRHQGYRSGDEHFIEEELKRLLGDQLDE